MVSGVKKDTGSFVYMRVKKHVCPDCGHPVFIKKIKKKIRSDSRAAKVSQGDEGSQTGQDFRPHRGARLRDAEKAVRTAERL